MNHDQFTYWLQGFVEMNGNKEPTKAQWKMIKDHLQLCFTKVTPPMNKFDMSQFERFEHFKKMNPYYQPNGVISTNNPMGSSMTVRMGQSYGVRNNGGGGC